MQWLKTNLNQYFTTIKEEREMGAFFVQNCLYPRLMFSPSDALYSIKFIKMLVDLRVPKINFLNIFCQIIMGIIPTIHCCTNNESENLGIFFMEWFRMIDRWTDRAVWEKECANYSGFSQKVGEPEKVVTFEYYINKIVEPIHKKFCQFLKMCL